ncbi:SAF domain-containing protein [Kitasatospora nipponensis]|uniref:SAF domain-containing protein n=1 Tax=Kitasatospora nipponensis TaxID=258049 RepID=A0ABP4G6X1_9ACTN
MVDVRIPPARAAGGGVRIAAVKRRDRLRLVVGLAVMAVCALLFGVLAIVTGHRSRVLALARPVLAGQVLSAADLRSVLVSAEPGTATVGADQRDQVVGRRVSASLPAGLLLSEQLLGLPVAQPGEAVVAVALKEGRYPSVLGAGDQVDVYEAHPGSGQAQAAAPVEARVVDVQPGAGPAGGTVAMLSVPVARAGQVVADQEPAVVLVGGR